MDTKSTQRLEKVHPELKRLVMQLIFLCANLGMDVRVVQGLRTFEEQNKLYNQPHDGRDNDGDGRVDERDEKVTNVRAGYSNHNYGLATDLCKFKNGQPDWNDIQAFNVIGREAKALGLEWGGDWKFVDRPHVQLRGMSIKECLAAYNAGGLNRVWSRMYELLGGAKAQTFIPTADEVLEFGDIGQEVTKLQKLLVELNLLRPHEVDGKFGKITKNAVISFQRQNQLTADGAVGPGTKAKIATAIAANRKAFAKVSEVEAESAVSTIGGNSANFKIPNVSGITEKIKDASGKFENILDDGQSAVEDAANKTGSVIESTTETIEEAGKQIEKTITEKNDIFNPQNLPAFIPRFGKQWLLGLIPGAGFVSSICSYLANLPQWVIILLAVVASIALWKFFELLIKHREKVLEFITECYKKTADPTQNNLIPTNAADFIGERKSTLLDALAPTGTKQD